MASPVSASSIASPMATLAIPICLGWNVEESQQDPLAVRRFPCYSWRWQQRSARTGGQNPMAYTGPILERNRELARQINEEALKNPHSPYANKFVGIANGQVVVIADDLDQMIRRL